MKIFLNIKLTKKFDTTTYNNVIGACNYELPLIDRNRYNVKEVIHIEDTYYKSIVSQFRYMTFLNIRGDYQNNNEQFEIDINEYTNQYIKELNVSYISIKNISEINLYSILSIKINHCHIEMFPTRRISSLCHTLDLSNNKIGGILYLEHTNCKFIYLDNNRIEYIYLPYSCNTISINSNCLKDLELYNPVMKGNFCNNQITNFKISKWMEECNITNNNISTIDNLNKCEKLQVLNISYNKIENIDFSQNKLLKKLFIKNNLLNNIEGINECVNLEILDCSNNQLDIFEIPLNINRVDCSNNPIKYWDYNYYNKNESNLTSNIGNMLFSFLVGSKIKNKEIIEEKGHNKRLNQTKVLNLNKIEAEEFCEISEDIYYILCKNNIQLQIYYKDNEYIDLSFLEKFENQYIVIKLDKTQFYDWITYGNREQCIQLYRRGFFELI